MATIPQRELRNNIGAILRRAEAGERIAITVSGRPVAELGPPPTRSRFAAASVLAQILEQSPVDADWGDDLERLRAADRNAASDPWVD